MIEFDLKECISFGLGVIKRFLALDSTISFLSPLQKYLGVFGIF